MAELENVIASAIADSREETGTVAEVGEVVERNGEPAEEVPVVEAATEVATEEPAVEGSEAAIEAAKTAEKKDEVDELAAELKLKPRPDGKENRIPYSQVKKIVKNQIAKAEAALKTAHEAAIKEHSTKAERAAALETELQQLEDLVFARPEQFVQWLGTIPAYQKLLSAGGSAAVPDPTQGMPQPDYELGNGQKTYSPEGLIKLLDWQAARVEKNVEARYKPIEESFRTVQERDAFLAKAVPQVENQYAEAQSWDGFKENEAEILGVLQADSKQAIAAGKHGRRKETLESAYRKVVIPKIKADRQKLRESLLAEIKGAPQSTSTTVAQRKPAGANTGEPRDLTDVIKDSLKTARVV